MKNFAKKLSALLLTLAMVLTMMPMIAAPAFAEGDEASGTAVYTVSLNGEKICDLTAEWMEDNSFGPQVFPNITKKGINYVVAEGPAIDDVLDYAFNFYGAESQENLRVGLKKHANPHENSVIEPRITNYYFGN